MLRIVADLGNSRMKWGRVDPDGGLAATTSLRLNNPDAWRETWDAWNAGGPAASSWAISSVNPPVADALSTFLGTLSNVKATWYRSAADVPVTHALAQPQRTGADRALAVVAALSERGARGPGLVVLCGTAVTVERIAADGTWQGGAIAAGLGLTARALHAMTAQLPRIEPGDQPPVWGNATVPALEAGVYWGVVGAVRELLTRQAADLEPEPWVIWTGGDAERLAAAVAWPGAEVIPELVLRGIATLAFPSSGPP